MLRRSWLFGSLLMVVALGCSDATVSTPDQGSFILSEDFPLPVVEREEPRLPTATTGADDVVVNVTDASRIIVLNEAIAEIVVSLGLRDSIIGRDATTTLATLAEIPEVSNGHDISAEESGDKLSADELVTFVVLLYIAGHETTVNLIGNSMLALLRHPDQLALARATGLDSNAVDELLRFDGPVQHTVRVPIVPVTFNVGDHSITVEPGERVLTSLGAASHDPSVFDEPHRLDLRRPNANKHLAFAAGIHYCLGSALAKLEAQVAIESLLRRFSSVELADEPSWRDRLTIRGVDRLVLAVAR